MDKVKISIVIPVYNAEKYLDVCLSSILEQDMHSYEVILVDDGSTDSSPMICDRYSGTDARFRTIHKVNGGVSSARNAGISLSQGEYVMFVDADDALSPDALSLLSALTVEKPDIVIGGFNIYQGEIPYRTVIPYDSEFYPSAGLSEFFDATMHRLGELFRGPWAKLYRSSVIKKHSLRFNENLSYAEDKLFVYQFLNKISSAAAVDAPVYVSSRMKTGVVGKLGRSNQMESKMSSVIVSNAKPVDFNSLLIDWASWCEFTQPSIPTLSPFSNTLVSHSAMDGVSGKRSLKRRIPVPSNCSSAWMKYRESVHNPASSRVMTAVPAEPVKPLIHLRVSQCSDTYSLE